MNKARIIYLLSIIEEQMVVTDAHQELFDRLIKELEL
jgi:hypothetical protein